VHELRKAKGHEHHYVSGAAFRFDVPVMNSRQSLQERQIGGTSSAFFAAGESAWREEKPLK
jgi:hypothetical protein